MTSDSDHTKELKSNQKPVAGSRDQSKKFTERRRFMQGAGLAGAAIATGVAGLSAGRSAGGEACQSPAGASDKSESSKASDDPADRDEMLARYKRAQKLEKATTNPRRIILNSMVDPHWIGESEVFWYIRETRAGSEYRLVDAENQTNQPAFDHDALARSLGNWTDEKINPKNLQLADLEIFVSSNKIMFSAFDHTWEYSDNTKICRKLIPLAKKQWKLSPDGKLGAFVREHNLWIRDIASSREWPLTTDGKEFYEYGSPPTVYGRRERECFDFLWSPDSKRLLTQFRDTRNVGIGTPMVQHVPSDGSLRPRIVNPERRIAYAGDEHVEAWKLLSIDVEDGSVQWFDCQPQQMNYPHYSGFFSCNRGWWINNRYAGITHQDMDKRNTKVLKVDSHTGKSTVLFAEDPDNHFEIIPPGSHRRSPTVSLPDTNEFIWFSDRTGWTHLYLYDGLTGRLKKTITQGSWLVLYVLHYDPDRRELTIQTAGRKQDRNPYYLDICRVNIDTGQLTTLISSNHHYRVHQPYSHYGRKLKGVSPSGHYVVATRSRVDDIPVSLLLDRNGQEVMVLETAEPYEVPAYTIPPEPVMLKAADRETDIYAVVTRPSDFTPDKSYPIIDFTWGPPIGGLGNDFGRSAYVYPSAAAYAELGFIVVQVAGRGGYCRDKAFRDYSDPNVPGRALCDRKDAIAVIKQLEKRYPYMDVNRVGVVNIASSESGVLTGLLYYPEFYKAGTTLNEIADARLMPMAKYGADHPPYEKFAVNLQGKLLIMHGMMDDVISVSGMFRLVEALRKANKRFEMLVLPNLGHLPSSYTTQASWDYMVTHLLGVEPPQDFKLVGAFDD